MRLFTIGNFSAQGQLAFEAQIDLIYLCKVERGKRGSNPVVMARVANALNVELSASCIWFQLLLRSSRSFNHRFEFLSSICINRLDLTLTSIGIRLMEVKRFPL